MQQKVALVSLLDPVYSRQALVEGLIGEQGEPQVLLLSFLPLNSQ